MKIPESFPKEINLGKYKSITVRMLQESDEPLLVEFMKSLPTDERAFFRDDVVDPSVIRDWVNNSDFDKVFPLVAFYEDKLAANWTLHMREHLWTRHLAKLRGVVHPDYRGMGIANAMVYELLTVAGNKNVERVVIELVANQKQLLERFKGIGFKVEAKMKNWVKDFHGNYRDLIILSMKCEPAWRKMEELIMEYGTHGG